jgi:hypothetical protein
LRNQYLDAFAATSLEIGRHYGKLAPSELGRLEREIAATDDEIDDLVYELYGITEGARAIIEGAHS